jgi:hypothetical protein
MYYDSILDFNDAGGGDINCILVDVEVNTDSTTANTNRSTTSSTVESKQYYSLSIYFVAGRKENRHAIRVMDGNTFDVIAPTTLVKDYTGGKLLCIELSLCLSFLISDYFLNVL